MGSLEPRVRDVQLELLAWYAATGRDLPWRRTRDPYAVLVSELMLQQTQVARVVDAWTRFLDRFPTIAALAAAPVSDVVEAWQGLGYNRRAVNLSRAARVVVDRHGGELPSDVAALQNLPGIGPYTARAVASFAFDGRAAPVDVNVARVLARAVVGAPLGRREVQQLADEMADALPAADVATWNHALMDLGARRCTARSPACVRCPVAHACAWQHAGMDTTDPAASGAVRARPQRPFAGSDRYHRGRLVDRLRSGAVEAAGLAEAADLPSDPSRLERIVAGLVADGLAEWRGSRLVLPGRRP